MTQVRLVRDAMNAACEATSWGGRPSDLPPATLARLLPRWLNAAEDDALPGVRDQLRDDIAAARLANDGRAVPVPSSVTLRAIARSWGVPPWALSGREPTDDERRRWLVREMLFRRLGV